MFVLLMKISGRVVGTGSLFKQQKKNTTPEFRIWSPTTLLSQALSSLTTVDRTGNGASCWIWSYPKVLVKQSARLEWPFGSAQFGAVPGQCSGWCSVTRKSDLCFIWYSFDLLQKRSVAATRVRLVETVQKRS